MKSRVFVLLALGIGLAGRSAHAQPAPAGETAAPAAQPAPAVAPAPVPPTPAAPAAAAPVEATPPPPAVTPPPAAVAPAAAVVDPKEARCKANDAMIKDLASKPYDTGGTAWLPTHANKAGGGVDTMFYVWLYMSYFLFFAITAVTVYFVWKYRHRKGHKAEPSPSHNDKLEITWTIIPTIICVFLFVYGWRGYVELQTPPSHAVEINTVASKWNWAFTHPTGRNDDNLVVPVGVPVRLVMTSTDVLHSFFVPVFRVKQDVVPRRYTYAWFEATAGGVYRLYCTEYCGTDHSQMKKKVIAIAKADYETYISCADNCDGKCLFEKKGCIGCHSTDGSPRVGPSLKGGFGTDIKLASGDTVKVDDNYLRESIVSPQAKSRPGFPPAMPQITLSEKELGLLIQFIKEQK